MVNIIADTTVTPLQINLPDENCFVLSFKTIPDEISVSKELFEELWAIHPRERGNGIIMGNLIEFPRWQESFGQAYYFTGKAHAARSLSTHPFIEKILKWICHHSGENYKQVLINWYSNGNDYIGLHSDSEKQLVKNSSIYSFSFGQKRDFVIKATSKSIDPEYRLVFPLEDNSLVIMCGEMQKYYKHSVPKRALSKTPDRRINITMRLFK